MNVEKIDNGKSFDFGKTSVDYAKYRDIYPEEYYECILNLGLCIKGQKVLDIGTGTGVLPRNMYKYGAEFIGTDIAENQIEEAKRLAGEEGMKIEFRTCASEDLDYEENTFDVITACQCIWYPDHKILAPKIKKMLKPGGKFLILYMAWIPGEDKIANASEKLVHEYNPEWTGYGEVRKEMYVPEEYLDTMEIIKRDCFDVKIPFTREKWHGRMRTCRGTSASMKSDVLSAWDEAHRKMLENQPEKFDVLHFITYAELINNK